LQSHSPPSRAEDWSVQPEKWLSPASPSASTALTHQRSPTHASNQSSWSLIQAAATAPVDGRDARRTTYAIVDSTKEAASALDQGRCSYEPSPRSHCRLVLAVIKHPNCIPYFRCLATMPVLRMEQLVERVPGWLSSMTCCLSGMTAKTLDRGCLSRDLLPRRHFVNRISLGRSRRQPRRWPLRPQGRFAFIPASFDQVYLVASPSAPRCFSEGANDRLEWTANDR
jgi:hypothetical protein